MPKKLWNKNYVLLLQASAVSTVGDLMYSVAIGYWVYTHTGSSSLMGIMSAISMFVTMFLSPFSGSIIDKCDRKWILILGDAFQGILMLTVGVLAFFDKLSVPGVLIAAFLAALGGVFYSPAANTSLIDIIPRDDMVRGQSLFSGVNSFINMTGTAFSGVLVAFFGVPLIIVINGLSNLYSAASELFISIPKTVQQGDKVSIGGILRDSRSAITEILSNTHLRIFIPCVLIINLLASGPFSLILPFTAQKGFSVEEYGYLMSIWSVSSLVSVLILGIFKLSPKARFWTMAISFSASCAFMIPMFLTTQFTSMAVFALISGFANSAGNTILNASLVLAVPEKNRGAIMGVISSASIGGTALSSVIYGFLGDVFPLYAVFAIGTALSFIPMLFFCFHRTTREFILTH